MIHSFLAFILAAQAAPVSAPSLREELMASFHELTRPVAEGGPENVCLTPLVRRLNESWDVFSPSEKAEITAKLAPWATELPKAFAPREESAAPAPPAASSTPCFTFSGDYDVLEDPEGRFYVTWEPGAISESTAQDFLDALTHGYETEVDELGWWQPHGMDDYPMLIYVYEDDSSAGAYTTVNWCSDSIGYMSYIVASSGSFYGSSWYQDMAVHEFNHASQWGYTDTEGYVNTNIDLWWWEATATWVQEHVNPDLNWWSQYIWGYTNAPYLALETSNQSNTTDFWHMYGMSIWAFYLDEHVGGHDFVMGTWELAAGSRDRSLNVREMIEDMGEDFDAIYLDFIVNTVVMDFDERRYFGSVEMSEEISELPASGESGRKDPEGYGQNYLEIDKDALAEGKTARVSFDGEDEIDWYAVIVQSDGKELIDYQLIELDDANAGSAEITFDGDSTFTLVVSPLESEDSGRSYTWSVDEVVEEEPAPEEDTGGQASGEGEGEGEAATDTGSEPEGEEGDGALNTDAKDTRACGCATTNGTTSLGLAGLVGLLALSRRRRNG